MSDNTSMDIAGIIYHGGSLHFEATPGASGIARTVLVTVTWQDPLKSGETKKCGLTFSVDQNDSYAMISDPVEESLRVIFRHFKAKFYNAESLPPMVVTEM